MGSPKKNLRSNIGFRRTPISGEQDLGGPRIFGPGKDQEKDPVLAVLLYRYLGIKKFFTRIASMVMVTTHQQIVLNVFSYGVLHLVREAVGTYFQRRQLGAESSGGMLAGAARGHRGPPPKASMARTMISKHNRERLKVGCRHP